MEQQEKYNPPTPLKGEQKVGNSPFRGPGGFRDADMQLIIGWILRVGVAVSMTVVIIGGIFFIYRHGDSIADYRTFKGVPAFIQGTGNILRNVFLLRGQAIIEAGIILLIATPILRVLFSAIGFLIEKDYLYVFISLLVMLIIFVSMFGGYAG